MARTEVRLAAFDAELDARIAEVQAARAVAEYSPSSPPSEGESIEDTLDEVAEQLPRQQSDPDGHFPSGAFNTPASPELRAHLLEQVPELNDRSLLGPAGPDESSEGEIDNTAPDAFSEQENEDGDGDNDEYLNADLYSSA
jgi:hypothetical protein